MKLISTLLVAQFSIFSVLASAQTPGSEKIGDLRKQIQQDGVKVEEARKQLHEAREQRRKHREERRKLRQEARKAREAVQAK